MGSGWETQIGYYYIVPQLDGNVKELRAESAIHCAALTLKG